MAPEKSEIQNDSTQKNSSALEITAAENPASDCLEQAVLVCEKADGKKYVYKGDDPLWNGQSGFFEVLEDMNCCAPTQDVLFSFQSTNRRKVMQADELIDFFEKCRIQD